jgi:hypothetical protein
MLGAKRALETDPSSKPDWRSPIKSPLEAFSKNSNNSRLLREGPPQDDDDLETNYLFRKLEDAFEILVERVADQFLLSDFNKQKAIENQEKTNKKVMGQVEWLIHNIRATIRINFKAIFHKLCEEMRVKESLQAAGTNIEKERTLQELESLVGNFVSDSADHYFESLNSVLQKLQKANEQLSKGSSQPLSEQSQNQHTYY